MAASHPQHAFGGSAFGRNDRRSASRPRCRIRAGTCRRSGTSAWVNSRLVLPPHARVNVSWSEDTESAFPPLFCRSRTDDEDASIGSGGRRRDEARLESIGGCSGACPHARICAGGWCGGEGVGPSGRRRDRGAPRAGCASRRTGRAIGHPIGRPIGRPRLSLHGTPLARRGADLRQRRALGPRPRNGRSLFGVRRGPRRTPPLAGGRRAKALARAPQQLP
jgi:hypothetical protein